jgi:glyoxylase-like metal-dependent hydrolase (beta-lactamase superfamily II)
VLGGESALLVDTLSTGAQARELVEAARAVTAAPWTVVNTHHHFDHCFGNAEVVAAGRGGGGVWAHTEATVLLTERGEQLRRRWYEEMLPDYPDLAAGLAEAPLVTADHTVHTEASVDLGGRRVVLRHLGRGHTAGDLVVHVPDAGVVVAGDLVEQGAPPSFEDSYPLRWPETVAALLRLVGPADTVVPGHGAPVDREFVLRQQGELAELAWLIREGDADGAPIAAVAARAPFPEPVAVTAVRRGYAELAGELG